MMIKKQMIGVQLSGHGGPEVLNYREDIDVPVPQADEVLIAVAAAGVNNTDINTRTAWYSKNADTSESGDSESSYLENNSDISADATWSGAALKFPRIQGADVCGTIVAVGENVSTQRMGERVLIEPCLREVNGQFPDIPGYFGSECDGGFAEYTVVAARHAYAVNSTMSDAQLASFPCSYSTAENMLTRANVCTTDTVLITGASGGVGSAAIQLAKARGANVIAITSPNKVQQLQALGADKVITRDADLLATLGENSVEVVIDLVAGPQWPQLLQLLKPRGRYAVSGAIAGPMVELDIRTLYLKDLSFFGCTVLEPQVFQNLINCIEQGKIVPLVAETFPLKEIDKAQQLFIDKQHVGKIVLKIT